MPLLFKFARHGRARTGESPEHAQVVGNVQPNSKGVSNSYKVKKLNQLIRGWINYFKIGSMKTLCKELDANIRFRLRKCIWKHWKNPQTRERNLMKLGIDKKTAHKAANCSRAYAHVCSCGAVNIAITNKRLTSFGLVSMLDYYTERCVTC